MNPLLTIAQFEFRYTVRQPTFLLFTALILGQGIWYTFQLESLFPTENPTLHIYTVLSSLGLALAIVTVLLAGQSLTKDAEYKTTSLFYTLPITTRTLFAGRFLGTLLSALVLAVFYPLGVFLTLSIYSADPVSWMALLDGFIWLVVQNVLISVSITFALTVFLGGIRGAYVSLFLVVLYFLLNESQATTGSNSDIWQLLDPFAVGMMRDSIDTMQFFSNADELLSFSDILIINRILWLGIAFGALAQAESHFSFATFGDKPSSKKRVLAEPTSKQPKHYALPAVHVRFGGWVTWQTLFRLAKMEFRNLIRQPIFQITSGLLIILAVMLITAFNVNPDFPELPITSRMTALRLSMGVFIGVFLLVMTGELIFQERTVKLWSIFDALPQSDFVLLMGKLLALIGAAALMTILLFLTGIGLQVSDGFFAIDWHLYGTDLLMDGFLRYCQLIIVGAFVAVLINNRTVSHIVNLLIFALLTVNYQVGNPDQQLYLYSFLPGSSAYSDLIGYGAQAPLRPAIHLVWWGVSGLFLTLFLLTWNRGASNRLPERIRQFQSQLGWPYAVTTLVSILIVGIGFRQLTQQHPTQSAIQYSTKTASIQSISGRPIAIDVRYKHPYQVQTILTVAQSALRKGEELFGPYPYSNLQICEIPDAKISVSSAPGRILISEKQGWTADYRQPQKLDHIDYLVAREIFKQWLSHRINPVHQPGDGFVRQSLAEYLALQTVAKRYGSDRLKQRLAQRTNLYLASRSQQSKSEVPVLQSSGNDALERGRAALALTSIGQVWGDAPLSLTISQFYRESLQRPTSATSSAFADKLSHQLPDSLKYLTTYLSDQLWFDFKVGRIANLPNGLTVEIIATKWRETQAGKRQLLPINDYIPLAVLDQNGRKIYHQLVHPNPDEQFVSLPVLPDAKTVVIDPLGTWLEPGKRDNYKLF